MGEYEIRTQMDRIEHKIDLIMQKLYPEAFKESPEGTDELKPGEKEAAKKE